jgi:hypothetical protein
MNPPNVDSLNEQLGMEAVQGGSQPKINKERDCKCQVNNKYAHVQVRVTVHATEASPKHPNLSFRSYYSNCFSMSPTPNVFIESIYLQG